MKCLLKTKRYWRNHNDGQRMVKKKISDEYEQINNGNSEYGLSEKMFFEDYSGTLINYLELYIESVEEFRGLSREYHEALESKIRLKNSIEKSIDYITNGEWTKAFNTLVSTREDEE